MCGLIGAATKNSFGFSNAENKFINEMLYMDALRGDDSTGVCLVENDGSVVVAKQATWAPSFMCHKEYTSIDNAIFKSGKIFMGHNRKATVGNVVTENAHPFIVNKELVLMHNGSLFAHKHLADTAVDSEAIAIYLHTHWDDEASAEEKAKVLAKIGGAWALVWYDLRTEKLNIVRNVQRPMFYAQENGNVFWASDEFMLRCGLSRNYIKAEVKSLPIYTVLTFDGSVLQEVALPTDPFSPQKPATTQHGGKGTKATTVCEGSMSKNSFKKFIRFMEGKTITFNIEDYVDVNGGYHFYGDKTEWDFSHEITGACKTDEKLYQVMANYGMAQGVIKSAVRDKETGHTKFYVELSGVANYAETTTSH